MILCVKQKIARDCAPWTPFLNDIIRFVLLSHMGPKPKILFRDFASKAKNRQALRPCTPLSMMQVVLFFA